MNKSSQRQYLIWGAIAIAALIGISLIAYLIGIMNGPQEVAATSTATSPSPTATVVTLQSLKSQAKLSTIEANAVAEIYRENVPEGWLDGVLGRKEKLLMLVYGNVQAGFDLEKLKEEDLWTDGSRVRLVLPAPEVLNSSINFDRTHIVYYENSLLLEENNPNLQGEALEEAQKAIEQAALNEGLLNEANKYGQLYFENLLYSLGFTEVEVVVDAQIFEE